MHSQLLPLFCGVPDTLHEGYFWLQITATIVPRPTTVPTVRVGFAKSATNAAVHLIGSLILPLTVIATIRALRNMFMSLTL